MDIAETIAEQHPDLKGRKIVDENGLAYELSEVLLNLFPTGVEVITQLSKKHSYSPEEIKAALTEIAMANETSPDAIIPDRFETITSLL